MKKINYSTWIITLLTFFVLSLGFNSCKKNTILPKISYSGSPFSFEINKAITSITPSNTGGAVVSYSVSPTLPTGLSLDTKTGIITGTPTVESSATDYTITATNDGGNSSTKINITVLKAIAKPSISYTGSPFSFELNKAITNLTPTNTGGAVDTYSIAPALPAGLSIDAKTGIISGTPTAESPATDYTITATNSAGSSSIKINIKVLKSPSISYTGSPFYFQVNNAITDLTPKNTGGIVDAYSIAPALPVGLSIDAKTGIISGTPTEGSSARDYTITATNSIGSSMTLINITTLNVYTCGYEGNFTKVWKNGIAMSPLTDGTKSVSANSISVVGNDVYVAGYESNGSKNVAKFWKNGAAMPLTIGNQNASAYSISVVGNDVYVAGYESNGSKTVAKVWKNDEEPMSLTDGTKSANAYSISVVGNDVYVAVNEGGNFAKFWKNSTATPLTDGTKEASASSISVVGNDVYVAGYEGAFPNYVAKVWKNGKELMSLTDGTTNASALSISVVGNDVYVAGYESNGSGKYVAKVWKNDKEPMSLTDGTQNAQANSISVVGNDVYVAGNESNGSIVVAKVWKNGKETTIKTEGVSKAEFNGMFITAD